MAEQATSICSGNPYCMGALYVVLLATAGIYVSLADADPQAYAEFQQYLTEINENRTPKIVVTPTVVATLYPHIEKQIMDLLPDLDPRITPTPEPERTPTPQPAPVPFYPPLDPRPNDPCKDENKGKCKIEVRSYPVRFPLPLPIPLDHTFIVFTNEQGNEILFRGGPEYGFLNPWKEGYRSRCSRLPYPPGYGAITVLEPHNYGQPYTGRFRSAEVSVLVDYGERFTRSITAIKGTEVCRKFSLLSSESIRINTTCEPYQRQGPNSNSVTYTLLKNAGIPTDKPIGMALGWGTLL